MKSDQFFVSNEMDVRPPPAKKQKQYAGVYQADWGRMFEGMIAPSKFGEIMLGASFGKGSSVREQAGESVC